LARDQLNMARDHHPGVWQKKSYLFFILPSPFGYAEAAGATISVKALEVTEYQAIK
jgi:hypothetical protein